MLAPFVQTARAAASYPSRPVRLLVGFAPSGAADILARLVAQWLSDHLGQPFVVENRPGAAMNIATGMVAKAPPDGYTLLNVTTINAWNGSIYKDLDYNFVRDIAPVASMSRAFGVLEVHPSLPVKNVAEFIAYAKANPGKINMGTGGPGSGPHMYGSLFEMMTGVDLVPVHYHGTGPALPDLLSGRLQCMFDLVTSSIGYIRDGKLRPFGVTTAAPVRRTAGCAADRRYGSGYEAAAGRALARRPARRTTFSTSSTTTVNAALADPRSRRGLPISARRYFPVRAPNSRRLSPPIPKMGKGGKVRQYQGGVTASRRRSGEGVACEFPRREVSAVLAGAAALPALPRDGSCARLSDTAGPRRRAATVPAARPTSSGVSSRIGCHGSSSARLRRR